MKSIKELVWDVVSSRNNSATPVIERSNILSVSAHSPRPPLTRGYFKVQFTDNGKERRRLIMLPGILSNGKQEYVHALEIMKQSGLLN